MEHYRRVLAIAPGGKFASTARQMLVDVEANRTARLIEPGGMQSIAGIKASLAVIDKMLEDARSFLAAFMLRS